MSFYTEVKGTVITSVPVSMDVLEPVFSGGVTCAPGNTYEVEAEVNYFNTRSGCKLDDIPAVIAGEIMCTSETDDHYIMRYENGRGWVRHDGVMIYPSYTGYRYFFLSHPDALVTALEIIIEKLEGQSNE